MTALTDGRLTPTRTEDGVTSWRLPVKASAVIYPGALVALDGAVARPAATATGLRVLGRAETRADNSTGADGAIVVAVRAGTYRYENATAGDAITTAHIGRTAYAVDDQTVALTAAPANGSPTRSPAGVVRDVDATGVWVEVGTAAPLLAS